MITTDDLNAIKGHIIEGYVVRGKSLDHRLVYLFYKDKPTRGRFGNVPWVSNSKCYELPGELFPNLQWSNEPIKVKLSIKVIE